MKYDPTLYPACTVPAADVQRVKGLGFLRDKTTADCFNARVITRNGKISADEMYAIADAARRYGKGEVAFTTRQTVEVHIARLGNIAFATSSFELFLNYGNQIRARSKAQQTFLIQLACGANGYLPTERAERGGHYSAYISSGVTGHAGGDILVRKTVEEINKMFNA